jgi:hypothetical protein
MASSGMLRRVVLTRATRRNIPEEAILHSHRCENLKSYMFTQSVDNTNTDHKQNGIIRNIKIVEPLG